ncbi:MAG: TolC family protein [Halanaerobiales bacterium]|nr:TolC family protein [Halanaerobiales bacterium]
MFNKKTYIALITLMIITAVSFNISAEELSLNEAVNTFIENSSQLENAKKDIQSSEIDLQLAKKGKDFEVNLQSSYTRLGEAPQTPSRYLYESVQVGPNSFVGEMYPIEFEELSKNNFNTSLTISKPLYLGGKVTNSIELSERSVSLNELKYEQTLNQNLNRVVQSYFNVLIKESVLSIYKSSLELVKSHLETVQKNYEAGLVIQSNVNEVQIELNKTRQSILTAENELKVAKKRFADLLELEDADFTLKQPESINIEENLDTQLDKAYNNRFEVLSLSLNKEMQEINKKLEDTLYKPSLMLQGNYRSQGDSFDFTDGDFSVTLSGSIPLYDGNKSNLKQQKIAIEQSKLDNNEKQLKDNIETEIMAALYKIDENRESLEIANQNEEQALENLNQAQKRFENGVGTSRDVLRAETNLKQIQISKSQTYYQYLMSKYNLLYQTGTLNKYFGEVVYNENK